ncbi:PspC domain-containing protein [Herbiconiux daphne]|uniref:PspC domain-containing protein n=1 Tax=Herbiconiux daphne TaxID=2970914 RepID=A0ABT2H3H1_9MICO|nr:PspC domain-containing protein [Herbiconiux daphne]MCS5734488.1 PspC domain-containing protein [Herbiconiux daphne]
MSTTPPAPPAPRPVGASFFGWIRSLGVTRPDGAWIAGVCAGVAARTGLDPLLVRGIAIVVAVLGGPVFLAYAVGWALLPDARGHIHAESAVNGRFTYPMIFIGIAAVLTFLPFTRGIWFDAVPQLWGMPDWLEGTLRTLWVLALIAGAIWLTVVIARRAAQHPGTPPAAATAEPSSFQAATAPDAATGAHPATDPLAPTADPLAPTPGADDTWLGPDAGLGVRPDAGPEASAPPTAPYAAPPAAPFAAPPWTQTDWHRERHEQAREQARARAEAWKAAHPQPRGAGAAFSSVVLGIALMAAAVVGIGYGAVVPDGKLVLVISIAALGVIAAGIVIAGIRGRTSGGLGPFAFLLALVVLFTGVLPAGTEVQPFGTQTVQVSQAVADGPDSYLLIAGKTVVDADDLTARSPGGTVDVWLGAGQTEVRVPSGLPFRVESHVFAGTVTSTLGTERSGVFVDDDRLFTASGPVAGSSADSAVDDLTPAQLDRLPVIRIWLLAGTVSIVPENDENER